MLQGLIREVAGSKSGGPKKGFQAGDTSSPTGLSHTPLAAGGFPPQLWSLRWTQPGATPAQPPSGTTMDAAIARLMSQMKMGQRLLQF